MIDKSFIVAQLAVDERVNLIIVRTVKSKGLRLEKLF